MTTEQPLRLCIVTYTDETDPCCPDFTMPMQAYDLEHVEEKFYNSPDADGWVIVSVEWL